MAAFFIWCLPWLRGALFAHLARAGSPDISLGNVQPPKRSFRSPGARASMPSLQKGEGYVATAA
nr:hypothetical protein [Pseudomonas sp.]